MIESEDSSASLLRERWWPDIPRGGGRVLVEIDSDVRFNAVWGEA
jgi:hypothetical protein